MGTGIPENGSRITNVNKNVNKLFCDFCDFLCYFYLGAGFSAEQVFWQSREQGLVGAVKYASLSHKMLRDFSHAKSAARRRYSIDLFHLLLRKT